MGNIAIKIFVNFLTIFRLVFTFAMPFLIKQVSNITFLVIVAILYFTDFFDGLISRTCKVQTLFGSIMDTLADKVLSIFLILCISGNVTVLYVVLIGEIIIATINLIGTINGATIVATMLGRVKMWAIAIAILLGYMFYFGICDILYVNISGGIVVIMQLFLFYSYIKKAGKIKEFKLQKLKLKKGKDLSYALFNTDYYLSTIDVPIIKKLTI